MFLKGSGKLLLDNNICLVETLFHISFDQLLGKGDIASRVDLPRCWIQSLIYGQDRLPRIDPYVYRPCPLAGLFLGAGYHQGQSFPLVADLFGGHQGLVKGRQNPLQVGTGDIFAHNYIHNPGPFPRVGNINLADLSCRYFGPAGVTMEQTGKLQIAREPGLAGNQFQAVHLSGRFADNT